MLAWAFHNSAYEIELALSQALRNFPIKPLGWLLWPVIFPWGRRAVAPVSYTHLDVYKRQLCQQVNDWEITHVHADLPPPLWDFIKQHKFFGMIIPKQYGGLGFSALAHHKVCLLYTSRCV